MSVLVHVDVFGGVPDADALGVLTGLRVAGAEPGVILCGHEVSDAVEQVALYGPNRMYVVDHPALARPVAAPRVAVAKALIESHPAGRWFAATNTLTVEVAGALAGVGIGVAWGLTGVSSDEPELTATRLTGQDSIVAHVRWSTAWGVGLFRSHTFDPEPMLEDTSEIVPIMLDLPDFDDRRVELAESASVLDGIDLAGASVIVAAGRGIGDAGRLDLIRQLADRLGGAVGVSLPLVEMGWAPRSMQVGQTGTIVAPLLYIGCGISGQIQHRVGMERAGTIVAINTDPDAPMMRFCDLAVVGDVGVIVPRLIELLGERPESTGSA